MASAVHTFISYLALSTPAPLEELLLHPFYLQLFGGICLPGESYRTDNTRYDRILTAPSLSVLFLHVTEYSWKFLLEYLVFLWVNVEQGMLHDREIVSWIDRRKFDNDESVIKKIPFSFFLFRSLDALRNIICESFFPIPLFLILWFE